MHVYVLLSSYGPTLDSDNIDGEYPVLRMDVFADQAMAVAAAATLVANEEDVRDDELGFGVEVKEPTALTPYWASLVGSYSTIYVEVQCKEVK